MEGLKRLVNDAKHRKEVVAGGLARYLVPGTLIVLKTMRHYRLVW